MKLISVSIILFSFLAVLTGCRDVIFNNPLDPDASKETLKIIRVIETPVSGEGDIAFDGEKFWKIDMYGNLTAIDREAGTVIRSYTTPAGSGVTFFRDRLYLCSSEGENILIILDPLSGDVLNRVAVTGIYPGFLAVSGDSLVIYDSRSAGIFRYDPDTGDAQRLFEAAGVAVGGIEMYKGGLLISDKNTNFIYRFSLSGQVIDVFSSTASGIGGLTVDNSDYIYLFTIDGKIYKVSLP
ncbi:MAG: hypothetical protein GY950_03680 [bacterium]|nr:hypothetical protein [bacterium]